MTRPFKDSVVWGVFRFKEHANHHRPQVSANRSSETYVAEQGGFESKPEPSRGRLCFCNTKKHFFVPFGSFPLFLNIIKNENSKYILMKN